MEKVKPAAWSAFSPLVKAMLDCGQYTPVLAKYKRVLPEMPIFSSKKKYRALYARYKSSER